MLQLYKVRFNTANLTLEDMKSMYSTEPPANEQLQTFLETYQALHGVEFAGISFPHLGGNWSIGGWNEQDDDKFRDWIYQIEQDEMFGTYINQREEFLADWAADEYEPTASWSVLQKFVEVLEPMNNLETVKKEIIDNLTQQILAAGHEKNGVYSYAIERDMTDAQIIELIGLFVADEDNDGVKMAREDDKWIASYHYKYVA